MREESAQRLARGQARGQLVLLADDIGEQRGSVDEGAEGVEIRISRSSEGN
jgi:hypothetical protein